MRGVFPWRGLCHPSTSSLAHHINQNSNLSKVCQIVVQVYMGYPFHNYRIDATRWAGCQCIFWRQEFHCYRDMGGTHLSRSCKIGLYCASSSLLRKSLPTFPPAEMSRSLHFVLTPSTIYFRILDRQIIKSFMCK